MTMKRKVLAAGLLMALLAGCAAKLPAPVADRRPEPPPVVTLVEMPAAEKPAEVAVKVHVVQKGETLIAVALQYGLDYRELAAWNNIENVNVIRVGQELRVSAPGTAVASSAPESNDTVATPLVTTQAPLASESQAMANSATLKVEPRAVKVPYSDKALAQLEAEARTSLAAAAPSVAAVSAAPPALATPLRADDEGIDWVWPAKGKIVAAYTEASKGMDISGSLGLPVLAAASGKVVYSGTGLRGYGKLVIIKHNNTYLSAYAHNHNIVVKEGEEVKKGQKIAEMGSTDTEQVKLHFEIRKQGKPVDPSKYLPAG
jgi:lipoprotein NlpD